MAEVRLLYLDRDLPADMMAAPRAARRAARLSARRRRHMAAADGIIAGASALGRPRAWIGARGAE